MTEGVVAEWHKKIGDKVKSGELLAEIETDKAAMEFESPEDGILLYHAPKGSAVPVNNILAIIGKAGEDISAILTDSGSSGNNNTQQTAAENSTAPAPALHDSSKDAPQNDTSAEDGRIKISPLAKSMARESNIDLQKIKGTGDEGRIIRRDIEAYLTQQTTTTVAPALPAEKQPSLQPETATAQITTPVVVPSTAVPVAPAGNDFEDVRVSQMRKTIARRLAESKFTAPHFYLKMEVQMDTAMAWRKRMNELAPTKISFNDLVVKAAAMALRQHPAINSSWLGEVIRFNKHINIGVAVAVEEGLLVPVLRHADQKSLTEIGNETRDLAQKAKDRKLQPAEMQGNTFTISNLGMFDIDEFTAIINPPDSCILAVGRIAEVPAIVNGEIKAINKMKLTLSCDHRVVDGATGAKFLQTLKALLEEPMRLLL